MPRPKRALAELNSNEQLPVPQKRAKADGKGTRSKAQPAETTAQDQSNMSSNFQFITFARPAFDIRAELDDREDFDSEDEDEMKKLAKQRDADVEKYHYKPIADFQDYKWVISTIGKDLLGKYVTQSMKTDPDDFGMYIYNDFASYGQQEIVENMIQEFAKEFQAAQRPHHLWASIEGMQFYFNIVGTMPWYMIDDGVRFHQTALLAIHTMFAALGVLDREGLLRSGSPIPNLALVVAMFFSWVNQIEGVEEVDEKDYCGMIVALMERRGLIIGGLHKMEFLEDFEAAPTKLAKFDKIPAKGQVEKDISKYTLAFKRFAKSYGRTGSQIGGTEYDISKMTKAERKKYSFDGKDPLDGASDAFTGIVVL